MQRPTQGHNPPWTILKILKWTADYFKSREVDSPRTAAEILLADILCLRRLDLYLRYDQPLQAKELRRFKESIRRRVQREPVAYITGQSEFWSLGINVSPDVLIPRPETECLVEAALALIPEEARHSVFEPGTGSGAIALALAAERRRLRIVASDASMGALRVAGKNVRQHRLSERIRLFNGQWFEPLAPERARFDMIVSNPPYIPAGDIPKLQPEIAEYEPRAALDGGADGLEAVRHLVETAHRHLIPGGCLLIEIGYDQGAAATYLAASVGYYDDIRVHKDYSGKDRVVQMEKKV